MNQVTQSSPDVPKPRARWWIAPHLHEPFVASTFRSDQPGDQARSSTANLVTDQPRRPIGNLVTPGLTKLADHQQPILEPCEVLRTQADLMGAVGAADRTFFRRDNLEPLIQAGLTQMTHPEDPNHPNQACVVTETGFGFLLVKEPESEDQHGEA
jgi:hypothetical protein